MENIKYEVVTDKPFNEALTSLIRSLERSKFSVWKLNFRERLHYKGIELGNEFILLEVCNAYKAKAVLTEHPDAGYFFPCKVAIYEVKGSVVIGMARPEPLIKMLGYDDLNRAAEEMEELLKSAIDAAV